MDAMIESIFPDFKEMCYTSKSKLAQDILQLCRTGIAFFYVANGKCTMRPEIRVMSDCTIFIRHFSYEGGIKYYKYVYEEVKYESLDFGQNLG